MTRYIDNSDLLPKWKPDDEVSLDGNTTPDWVSGLIMTAVNPHNISKEGIIKAIIPFLDHLEEMGVNGLWVNPVYDRGRDENGNLLGNGYGNMGPDTVDPQLTGTQDYKEGWLVLKEFVDEAHKRDIRVILDLISWGAVKQAPIFSEHPEWTTGKEDWGGYNFDWENEEFREWYIQQAVNIVLITGCDGLRYDLEPLHAGYSVDGEIKRRLADRGRKIFAVGEGQNERKKAYDAEQFSVTGPNGEINRDLFDFLETNPFLNVYNIVDCIKSGTHIGSYESQRQGMGSYFRYYTNMLSSHDSIQYTVRLNPLAIGYQAIFAPFIPLWYAGEECGEAKQPNECVLFDHPIDWKTCLEKPENRAFYEYVKAMIRVRRLNRKIFEFYPEHFYDTNICKVSTENGNLQAYARYADDTAILVIPNVDTAEKEITFYIPFNEAGLADFDEYELKDALTGELLAFGRISDNSPHKASVFPNNLRVLEVSCKRH